MRLFCRKRPATFETVLWRMYVQGGEDSWDALSCRSFFAKESLIIGLFCGKRPTKMRHPMTLRHPVVDLGREYGLSVYFQSFVEAYSAVARERQRVCVYVCIYEYIYTYV